MDSLSEKIWNILSNLSIKNIDYSKYYSTNNNISYEDIIAIWENYIKEDLKIPQNKRNIELDSISLKLVLINSDLSALLESLFITQTFNYKDDILMFYKKDSNKILVLIKSFKPLLNEEKFRLPYWNYFIESNAFIDYFNLLLKEDQDFCILCYTK